MPPYRPPKQGVELRTLASSLPGISLPGATGGVYWGVHTGGHNKAMQALPLAAGSLGWIRGTKGAQELGNFNSLAGERVETRVKSTVTLGRTETVTFKCYYTCAVSWTAHPTPACCLQSTHGKQGPLDTGSKDCT